MSTWLIPRQELSLEQLRAIELDIREHRVIFGAPGSGKTQILLHRARYLCDRWNIKTGRFHIFVFTNVLKDYIQSALDLLELPKGCISTLDYWCSSFYKSHIGNRPPWDGVAKGPDFTAIRHAVLQKIRTNSSNIPIYDFVLVDEAQDLDSDSFDLMRAISKHVTVCIDHKQQIYQKGSSETDILKKLGLKKQNMTLLEAFRCCPYIVRLSAQMVDDPEDRSAYIRQAKTVQIEKETPLLYYASNFEDEKRRLIEILRIRLAKGEKVAILFPLKRQVFGFAEGMREAGLEVETLDNLNFSNDLPKLITYHSAKGLTFDTILMPRLVPKSFPNMDEYRINRLLFVGITRATKWIFMSTNKQAKLPSLDRVRPLEANNVLTVQDSLRPINPSEKFSKENADDPLDLL